MSDNLTAAVYVPVQGSLLSRILLPGSALVGDMAPDAVGDIRVWFEGNAHEVESLKSYHERVRHAFSRMAHNYPTVARTVTAPGDVRRVGWVNHATMVITAAAELNQWLGIPDRSHDEVPPGTTVFEMEAER